MKISIQTLKGVKHELDVEESDTIRQVKEKIDQVHHLGPAASQKLIYVGKILNNEQTVGEIKIKPGDFLVVMTSKGGAAAKRKGEADEKAADAKPDAGASTVTVHATIAQPAAAAAATPAATPAPTPVAAAPPAAVAVPPVAVAPTAAAAAGSLVVGENLEGIVADLMNLGFSHERVMQALRASYNNPDRAAEYLFSGVPGNVGGAADAQGAGPDAGDDGGEGDMDPDQLANMAGLAEPELAQLRQLVQSNPQIIPALLQQLAQSNPELYNAVDANPAAFMRMLGPAAAAAAAAGGAGQGGQAGAAMGGAGGAGAGGPRPHTITITQEEKQSIDNLEALGFPRQRALEAFLICDKNEQLAANYLFDQMGEWQGGGD
jgi:UV excision repair protein RAD23